MVNWINYWLFDNPRLFIPILIGLGVLTVLMLGAINAR